MVAENLKRADCRSMTKPTDRNKIKTIQRAIFNRHVCKTFFLNIFKSHENTNTTCLLPFLARQPVSMTRRARRRCVAIVSNYVRSLSLSSLVKSMPSPKELKFEATKKKKKKKIIYIYIYIYIYANVSIAVLLLHLDFPCIYLSMTFYRNISCCTLMTFYY